MKSPFSQLSQAVQRPYVKALFDIVSRALVSASQIDAKIQQEIAQFPVGFRFAMTVFSSDLAFYLQVNQQHQFTLIEPQAVDLNIQFKHLNHAFLVLSFQESTAVAFARDRMIVDGDLAHAVRLVRCLNQLEAVILPKVVASLAVKQYPKNLPLIKKATLASQIYRKVAYQYLQELSS